MTPNFANFHHDKEQAEQTLLALSSGQIGTWRWNIDSNELHWDALNYEIFGIVSDQKIQNISDFLKLLHPDDQDWLAKKLEELIHNRSEISIKFRIIRPKDQKLAWILGRGKVLSNSDGLIMTGINYDISDEVNKQIDLDRKTKDLERSNLELEQFAYVASHDLQEPLRVVVSYADLLKLKLQTLNIQDEKINQYLNYMSGSATRMQEMILDILAYSRVGRKSEFQKTDLNRIIQKILQDLESTINNKQALLKIDKLPEMQVSEIEIKQLFQNLIANALKFTRKGIRPEINIDCQQINSNQWQFSISDNGIGMDPEFHERIFVIFQRLHTHEEFEGTGIGLALCRKIVENHRGKITVESKLNEGSKFRFILSNMLT